jgi:hypothetical protein
MNPLVEIDFDRIPVAVDGQNISCQLQPSNAEAHALGGYGEGRW